MQPQGHAQVLVQPARPRRWRRRRPSTTRATSSTAACCSSRAACPRREVAKLRRWGHEVEVGPPYAELTGGAQVVRLHEDGVRAAGSDPRKDGCALAQ